MATIARNIGGAGRRQRLIMGAVLLTIGLLAAVGLQVTGSPRGLRLILLLPFAGAALSLLQARDHT
jgi:fatty acid desaturase